MRGWKPLRKGDIVDLVAPGFACKPEELQGALRFLESWGLVPRMPSRLFAKDVISSNTDEARVQHLREAISAEDSAAIWCVRGGYGAIRMIPEIAKLKRPDGPPKLFVGLSDITSLHVLFNQKWGWPTVHGPLLDRLGKGAAKPRYEKEMKRFVFGEMSEIEFAGLKPLNDVARKRGQVKGKVSGGNLITIQSSMGTQAPWNTSGRILFFEDIGERGYKVDRVLEQFRQVGMFTKARAVVFGEFTGGSEADGSTRVPAVLKRFAELVDIPVFTGVASGHGVIQRPVPLETESVLHLGESGRLVCASGCDLKSSLKSKPTTHSISKLKSNPRSKPRAKVAR